MLVVGVAIAVLQGRFHGESVSWKIAVPVWVTPEFPIGAMVGVAQPLFIVTMASQNLPGVAVFQAHGYHPPISKIHGWTGVTNVMIAPCDGHTLNFAAITAAFCMGPDAHPDPRKRYVAAMGAGFFYGVIGLFGATLTGLFAAFPHALVLALAGFALLGTIGSGLAAATADERYREASMVSYFVVLSGVSCAEIGSAFWGIIAGLAVVGVGRIARRES